MRTPNLHQQQSLGIAVVAAAKLELGGGDLAGAIQSHGILFFVKRTRGHERPLAARWLDQTSNGPSFFATAALASVTYLGMPFS